MGFPQGMDGLAWLVASSLSQHEQGLGSENVPADLRVSAFEGENVRAALPVVFACTAHLRLGSSHPTGKTVRDKQNERLSQKYI